MARRRLNINPEMVETLAAYGMSKAQIALKLGCSEDTIRRKYATEYANGRSSLMTLVLTKQREKVEAGDHKMLVWYGQIYCGQNKNEPEGDKQDPLKSIADKELHIENLNEEQRKTLRELIAIAKQPRTSSSQ